MSYATIYKAANDVDFQGRCQVAMWKTAQNVSTEAMRNSDDEATRAANGFQARQDWCTRILQDRANIRPRQLAMQVLRDAGIAADPAAALDDAIQAQVDSILDDLINIG